jgi:hypothetical protein
VRLADATGATGTTAPAAAPASTTPGWLQAVESIVPTVLTARYQDKVLSTNLQRAQQGLPPLDTAQFQPGVQVELGSNTRNYALGAAALVAGALAFGAVRNARRTH